jgi:molybdate transport system substrate-binding protein
MRAPLAFFLLATTACCGPAAEITVAVSGAFTAAYRELTPEIERSAQHKLISVFGASMGTGQSAIPQRLARGEAIDVVILAAPALEALIESGLVRKSSRVDLARSSIGMAIKAGAARVPDIRTVDGLKRALLAAKSIAYSGSASGLYLSKELFVQLGIASQISGKSRIVEGEPVGDVVARGEAEIGFQQMSELLPVKGIEIVGPLPPGAQRATVFAAGIAAASARVEAAREVIEFLHSPAARAVLVKSGLEPVVRGAE